MRHYAPKRPRRVIAAGRLGPTATVTPLPRPSRTESAEQAYTQLHDLMRRDHARITAGFDAREQALLALAAPAQQPVYDIAAVERVEAELARVAADRRAAEQGWLDWWTPRLALAACRLVVARESAGGGAA